MRLSGLKGTSISAWSSQLLLLGTWLYSTPTVHAKDEPSITVTDFDALPGRLNYFEDSDVVLLQESRAPRTVWRSTDGGAKWKKADGVDHDAALVLVMHQYDPNRAYILTAGNQHWKTEDKGETWETFLTHAYTSDFAASVDRWLVFHADDPDKILFRGMECQGFFCEELVMYTTDGFRKTQLLRRQTEGCWWAKSSKTFTTGKSDLDASRTMCIVRSGLFGDQNDNRLLVSDNYFKQAEDSDVLQEKEAKLSGLGPVQGVVSIVEVQKYLLAATVSRNTAEMALYVTDDTDIWHRAVFPQDHQLTEQSYTVLESTNYSIQIDVRSNKRLLSPMGTLLTSNSNGTYFTRNLEHTNRDTRLYVDFEKVTGIQGIFLVNRVDNWEDVEDDDATKKIKTAITFDDGRTFQSVKTGDDDIQLHSMTEINNIGRIFSSPAPGLVMGNGNPGKYLKSYWDSNLYVSDDAGQTWVEGRKGPHKYEFGDQGSILLAVQDSKDVDVKTLEYSLDHGKSWQTVSLPDDLTIRPDILTTTQDSTSLKFLLSAIKGSASSPSFCMIAIDFEGLHEDTCKQGDMEDWFARKDEDGKPACIMGHTQKYLRRKKDAKCFIKHEFKEELPSADPCECTDLDFECDFNFAKDGDECKPVGPVIAPGDACTGEDPEETFKGSSGWRLIPGNTCKRTGGDQKDKEKKWKCSEAKKPQNGGSGEITVKYQSFEGDYDFIEKHYLERGESSSSEDETIIARPLKVLGGDPGKIYITHDHGKNWETPSELGKKSIYAIVPHPFVKDMVFFLTTGKTVYYTTDRGKNFDFFETPDPLDILALEMPLAFHPNKPEWLIWHGQKCSGAKCYMEASVSTDRGYNWHMLKRYVDRCEFTGSKAYKFRPESQIVCSARTQESTDIENNPLQLLYTNEFPSFDLTVALENVERFATMAEFIVVATENRTEGTLNALASIDGREYAPAHFPYNFQVPKQNAYTVLESSTHAVNLFVATETEEHHRYGSILRSNSNGTSYVLSVSGVNCDDSWYVDFEKMLGLEGVVLVNTVVNRDSGEERKQLQSRISHNDGAEWAFLPPPSQDSEKKPYGCSSKSGDEGCALHIHGYTERVDRGRTYSSESAIGLMFAIGNVGAVLGDVKDADTFMTQDAGLTWTEVQKGTWTWAFGDQGSIVVLAQRDTKTTKVLYSLDRGVTWPEKQISDSDVTITDITTLRSGSSQNFLLWGHNSDEELFSINIDFSGETDRPCVHDENDAEKSDYEMWSPEHPLEANGCLFGHKNQYLRKKSDRACYNGQKLQHAYNVQNCECTRRDFECDYNFEMDNHGQCKLVEGLQPKDPAQACSENPEMSEYYEPSGFRRIPLTTCKGGVEADKILEPHPCPGHEEEFEEKHGVSGVAIFFAVVIPIGVAALVGWWVYKNWEGKFGQIRLGEQSGLDNDSPLVKYPVIAISAVAAVVATLPLVASSIWRTVSSGIGRLRERSEGGRYSWLNSGPRRFTTRDSFARGRGDYAMVDDDEGELLGDDSEDEV
ncbi:vacuolar protein sorting [Xylariaceae sp. FL0255]|nr:vacuolar protein sorting [Xylariaceae sp. FL0255]